MSGEAAMVQMARLGGCWGDHVTVDKKPRGIHSLASVLKRQEEWWACGLWSGVVCKEGSVR